MDTWHIIKYHYHIKVTLDKCMVKTMTIKQGLKTIENSFLSNR